MTRGIDVVPRQLHADRYSAAQLRVIRAALDLFAIHGVSGTSLQMIAGAIGVTKAAVYHQFNSKVEIVLAVAEVEFSRLEDALQAAEAEATDAHARAVLLEQVVSLAVERRRWVYALQNDPAMVRVLGAHEPFLELMNRLYSVLNGEDATTETRVRTAILSAAFGGAVVHPLVADLDDATLQAELLRTARRLFDLPDE
ncbi:MAG: TetR/AcrR family transcriptional regulator [Acidimicrobiales bacterium]